MSRNYKLLDIQMRRVFFLQFFMAIAETLNSVADGIIAGRFLGSDALGVIALYSPIIIISGLLFVFISGANVMVCAAIGHGEVEEVRSVFSTCLLIVTGLSLLEGMVIFLFSGQVAGLLGAEGELRVQLSLYLRGMSPGIPGNAVMSVLMVFLSVNNDMKLSYISIAVSFAVNLILSILSVVLFAGNMFGIGLATSVSYFASAAVLSAGYRKKNGRTSLFFTAKGLCFRRAGEMVRLGSTKLYFTFSMLISQYLVNILVIRRLGPDGVAVLSVFNIMNMLMSAITSSLAEAVLTIGSIAYSQRDTDTFRALFLRALRLGLFMSVPAGLLMTIFRGPLSSLFFETGTTVWYSSCRMLILDAVYFSVNVILFVILYMYRSRQKMPLVNAVMVENQLGLAVFCALAVNSSQPELVWAAFAVNELCSILVIFICAWIRERRISFKAEKLLELDDFDMTGYAALLNASAVSETDASAISEKVCEIGRREKLPKRIYTNAGLCLEELIRNIVTHGFRKGKGSAQVFFSRQQEELFIYIWDNGTVFDTKTYIDQFVVSQDDLGKNIGLRIVAGLADELVYQKRFGMNFIMMRFSLSQTECEKKAVPVR